MTPLLRKANDDKAFERLYQRHVKDVFRYSLAVLGEPADAEDVTQTTFLNAYRAFQRGERPEKPENWLIAIAHNVCRQRFRQQQRRPSEVEFEDELAGAVERDEDGPTVDELRRAFGALQPNQRAALVMRELEGRSYSEIAEVLGITISALETLLFRARRALREQLEEQLSCRETALAISRQMDGRLSASERRALRAHLRSCPECSRLASSQRAQRKALRTLLAVPLPTSLQTFLPHATEAAAAGSAAAAGGTALAVKAAAVVAAGTLVGGGAYEGVKHVPPLVRHEVAAAPRAAAARKPAAARISVPSSVPVRRSAPASRVPRAEDWQHVPALPAVASPQASSAVETPKPAGTEPTEVHGKSAQAPGRVVSAGHRSQQAKAAPHATKPAKAKKAQPAAKKKKAKTRTTPAAASRRGPKPKAEHVAPAQAPPASHGNGKAKGRQSSTPTTDPATTDPLTVTVPDFPVPLPDPLKPVKGKLKPSVPPPPDVPSAG
jgi:RNA polymerase sigma-70 factor (ECF subfamily)